MSRFRAKDECRIAGCLPPSPLFPRIRCTLCPLRKFALFIRLKFSYPQCTHRTHHAMDAVHRVWILLLTIYKVLRLYNLPPTLLTLRYLASQEVCIRYKLESTPHTAEFHQICKYTCNTTHKEGKVFRLTDSIFGQWQCSMANTPPPKPLKLACTRPRTSVWTTQECAEIKVFFSSVFYLSIMTFLNSWGN